MQLTSKSIIIFISLILIISTVSLLFINNEDNIIDLKNENRDNTDPEFSDKNIHSEGYNGIYYLHDDLPEHGQDIGNTHDVGDLLRIQPHGNEERYCAKWVQFDFDEHVFGEKTNDESFTVESVYYHIWWKSANEKATIGIDVHGQYNSHTDSFIPISKKNAVSINEGNGYWLTTNTHSVSYFEKDIHSMTVKLVSYDELPSVYSSLNHYSFIILNLEDNITLKNRDKDYDGLNDYDELFVYFTNPEDPDTDNDGLSDFEEIENGKDGFITNPNYADMDNDEILDGVDPNPLKTNYVIKNNDWIVEKKERFEYKNLLLNSNLIVKNGGKLVIESSTIKMNQMGEQKRIRVQKGGVLEIKNSRLITDDPDHWYGKSLDTEHWHDECTFEVLGKVILRNNFLDYGSMIYIRNSNESIIENNQIHHYYYGIFCSYSSPTISGNEILPFIGNGIFLWHSSPEIRSTFIQTYIGTGISCYYSSPVIIDSAIQAGSNDFYLSGNSHPIVSDTSFNSKLVHIDDDSSSILVGTFSVEGMSNPVANERMGKDDNNSALILTILISVSCVIFSVYLIVKRMVEIDHYPKSKKNGRGEKNRSKKAKLRPKNSWKKR
jgi:parallel beta-helix repeat protein